MNTPTVINANERAAFEALCEYARTEPTRRQLSKFIRRRGIAWQTLRKMADEQCTSTNKLYARMVQNGGC